MKDERKRRWRLFGVGLTLLLLLGGALTAAPAHAIGTAAEARADRLQVPAGGSITVTVSGFDQYELLSSWASSARGTVYATADGETDYFGNATLTIQTGRFWEPGWWAVTVYGQYSFIRAYVTFEITPTLPDGTLELSPTVATPGSSINVRGTGFTDGEPISVWATRPDGGVNTFTPDLYSTNGVLSFSYDLPDNAADGDWSMTAYGLVSGRLLIAPFIVVKPGG